LLSGTTVVLPPSMSIILVGIVYSLALLIFEFRVVHYYFSSREAYLIGLRPLTS